MTQEEAVKLIDSTLTKMQLAFGKPVFDEWMLFSLGLPRATILYYSGPREETFVDEFHRDVHLISEELGQEDYQPGHFYFSRDAVGSRYDCFMAAGSDTYVIFNNTELTMSDISAEPVWTQVQVFFAELSERLLANPFR